MDHWANILTRPLYQPVRLSIYGHLTVKGTGEGEGEGGKRTICFFATRTDQRGMPQTDAAHLTPPPQGTHGADA